MKILCVSDDYDPLVYSQNIVERYKDIDFVIGAGDLPLKYYEFIVTALNKPLYFVFGNHHVDDLRHYKKQRIIDQIESFSFDKEQFGSTHGGDYIDGKVMKERQTGLLIAGLGGSMRYNNGSHQFTDSEMRWRIYKMIPRLLYNKIRYGRWLDILITHAPPKGIGDQEDLCHTGFDAFRLFMRAFKPKYLLHGHVHLIDMNANRISTYHGTEIINVYGSFILQKD